MAVVDREEMVRKYLELVEKVVRKFSYTSLPPRIDEDDLRSEALLALLKSIDTFNPKKGVPFEVYAYRNMRNAIVDFLRKQGYFSRAQYDKYKDMEEKYMQGEISEAEFDSLEGVAELSLESYLMRVYEEFPSRSNVEDEIARQELIRVVADGIREALDEKERLIITLRYYEGLAFKEIAHILDISPSRVSQLHTKALMKLKSYVQERYKGWVPY